MVKRVVLNLKANIYVEQRNLRQNTFLKLTFVNVY